MIRKPDAPIDVDREWRDLVSSHPFGHLIAPGSNRPLPIVVPTHFHFDGGTTIRLHLARANPMWKALHENRRCMLVVTAAVAYVPTSWEAEPDTPPEWGIPTSHYATAQMDCLATTIDDPDAIRAVLGDQLATMQPDEPYGDPLDPQAPYATELSRIRGLELTIGEVLAKFKFDGTESDAVRRQVVAGYRQRSGPNDAEALAHLLRRHPPA